MRAETANLIASWRDDRGYEFQTFWVCAIFIIAGGGGAVTFTLYALAGASPFLFFPAVIAAFIAVGCCAQAAVCLHRAWVLTRDINALRRETWP